MIDKFIIRNNWNEIKESCMVTIGKLEKGKDPSDEWKRKLFMAEHSPIRQYEVKWRWVDITYWVAMHFVRHVHTLWWCKTQRSDRTKEGTPRSELPQDAPVNLEGQANAQALINMARKRLCRQAAPETREYMLQLKRLIARYDPIFGSVLVPECVYRGFCPEMKTCGYVYSSAFQKARKKYTDGFSNRSDNSAIDARTGKKVPLFDDYQIH